MPPATPLYARRYYIADHLGSIRVVVNEQGAVIEARDHYPYGLTMPGRAYVQGQETREGFTGHELDAETGDYYAGARYYNPALGRWFVVDPLAELFPAWSPYNYALSNPLSFIDPDGREAIFSIDDDGNISMRANIYYSAEQLGSGGDAIMSNMIEAIGRWVDAFDGLGIEANINMINIDNLVESPGGEMVRQFAIQDEAGNSLLFNPSLRNPAEVDGSRHISVQFAAADPVSVQTMAHEIGHIFGLNDRASEPRRTPQHAPYIGPDLMSYDAFGVRLAHPGQAVQGHPSPAERVVGISSIKSGGTRSACVGSCNREPRK